jgi:hypothetical protein
MADVAPLTGGCACGAVRFTVIPPLATASYCHCTRCQRRTGTGASVNARVVPGSFTLLSGGDRLGRWNPPGGFAKVFCADCGSALFSQDPDDPEVVNIRFGAFDGDPGIRPQYRQYVAYAPAWDAIPDDGLPRYPEGRS